MTISLKSGFGVGDVDFTKLMDTTYKIAKGFHACSLTNFDNTSVPALSAGSALEIDGAVYSSDTETAIGGSPSDGDVYIKTVPSGSSATLLFTNTAPVWNAVKQGWYSPTGGEESYRYLEFKISKTSTSYIKAIMDEYNGPYMGTDDHFLNYPIGSTVIVDGYDTYNTIVPNERRTIYHSDNQRNFGLYATGSALTGTWACRGGIQLMLDTTPRYQYIYLFQRIA